MVCGLDHSGSQPFNYSGLPMTPMALEYFLSHYNFYSMYIDSCKLQDW